MKNYLCILFLFLFSFNLNAEIPKDKQDHMVVGAAISMVSSLWSYAFTENTFKSICYGVGVPIIASVGKEIYDDRDDNPESRAEVADVLYTAGGALIGTGISHLWLYSVKRIKVKSYVTTYNKQMFSSIGVEIKF